MLKRQIGDQSGISRCNARIIPQNRRLIIQRVDLRRCHAVVLEQELMQFIQRDQTIPVSVSRVIPLRRHAKRQSVRKITAAAVAPIARRPEKAGLAAA